MNLIEKATIVHYHRHRIAEYKDGTVQSLGWKEAASQVKRFEVIASVGDLNGSSILDVGCGYGDLKTFLGRQYSDFSYIGIDQMPEFIAMAKKRFHAASDTYFYQRDFSTVDFPTLDYVVASGALGYRCDVPHFYTGMIRKMYSAAKRALVFNLLDAAIFPNHPLLRGHDFDDLLAFCRTLSSQVKTVRGYLADDFTVFIDREQE